jgi:hypothetical protein
MRAQERWRLTWRAIGPRVPLRHHEHSVQLQSPSACARRPSGLGGFSSITLLMSGSSWTLQRQGTPAPQVQPSSSSRGRLVWFSQTQPIPLQIGQFRLVIERPGLAPKPASIPGAFDLRSCRLRRATSEPRFRSGVKWEREERDGPSHAVFALQQEIGPVPNRGRKNRT